MYTESSALLTDKTRVSSVSQPIPIHHPKPSSPSSSPPPSQNEHSYPPPIYSRQTGAPLRHRKSSFKITPPLVQQQQQQQHTQKTKPALNPESHHVRTVSQTTTTTTKKKKTNQSGRCDDDDDDDEDDRIADFNTLERRLIESIQIEESLQLDVNKRIADAIEVGVLHVPVMAFMITHTGGCQFVQDFRLLCTKYEVELLGMPASLNAKNLSLDMLHYESEYRRVVSLLLYLQTMRPTKTCICSRQPIAITPHPLEIFPGDESDATALTTTAITTTTTTASRTTTTTRVIHNNNGGGDSNTAMVIPNHTTMSALERFMLNCMRMRQTGHYYMIYVDLALSLCEKPKPRSNSGNSP